MFGDIVFFCIFLNFDSLLILCYAFNLLMAFDRLLLKKITYLLTLWYESSVCSLSVCRLSVCLSVCNVVAPIGKDLNFSAIFLHRLITHGLGQFVLKFWGKNRRGSRGRAS